MTTLKQTITIETPSKEICDFCCSFPMHTLYDAPDFETAGFSVPEMGMVAKSIGHWAACEECAALIDANKWDELTERAVSFFLRKNPWAVNMGVEDQIRKTYQQLRAVIRRAN